GLGSFKENEVAILPQGSAGHEVELAPETIELTAAGVVQNQLAERRIIAKEALHQVKAGGKRPSLRTSLEIKVGRTVRDNERVRKYAAKLLHVAWAQFLGRAHSRGGKSPGAPKDEGLTARRDASRPHLGN